MLEEATALKSLDVLDLLADGEWHTINEISTLEPLRKLPMTNINIYIDFLNEYDFIELSEEPETEETPTIKQIKLTPPLLDFIKKIKWIERYERKRIEKVY